MSIEGNSEANREKSNATLGNVRITEEEDRDVNDPESTRYDFEEENNQIGPDEDGIKKRNQTKRQNGKTSEKKLYTNGLYGGHVYEPQCYWYQSREYNVTSQYKGKEYCDDGIYDITQHNAYGYGHSLDKFKLRRPIRKYESLKEEKQQPAPVANEITKEEDEQEKEEEKNKTPTPIPPFVPVVVPIKNRTPTPVKQTNPAPVVRESSPEIVAPVAAAAVVAAATTNKKPAEKKKKKTQRVSPVEDVPAVAPVIFAAAVVAAPKAAKSKDNQRHTLTPIQAPSPDVKHTPLIVPPVLAARHLSQDAFYYSAKESIARTMNKYRFK